MKSSIEGKLGILLFLIFLIASAAGAVAEDFTGSLVLSVAITATAALMPVLCLSRYFTRPIQRLLRAMTSAVGSYRDGDFNHALAVTRKDELGDLLMAHNELSRALRKQHTQLVQRELLLDTVTQHSPIALVLVDTYERVEYANIAAGQLLNQGRSIKYRDFEELLQSSPQALREATRSREDCLFSAELNGIEESFHIAQRLIQINGRQYTLYLFKRLTRELSRQELVVWKKLIRVLSHELNNSLAPMGSFAQSGAELSKRAGAAEIETLFSAIAERAAHLHHFLRGYAEFAKLPAPRRQMVPWRELLAEVARSYPGRTSSSAPEVAGWFDRAQLAQALINLLKNAIEASDPTAQVEISVTINGGEHHIAVHDRGPGMSEVVMSQALLPFYSTKQSGTGLGLALVREIAEAHGGRVRLSNREGGGVSATISLPAPRLSL